MKAGRKRSSVANAQPSAAPEPAVSPHGARHASLALRTVATLLSFLNLCPLAVRPLLTDLDPSWVFGLNYAHIKGLVWGHDVAFTYGTWGFLSIPVNLGSNVDVAVACQLAAWLAALAPLWYLLCRKATLPGVVLFTLGTGFAHATITRFTSDEYLGFLSLLCLAAALLATRWAIPLAAAAVCA